MKANKITFTSGTLQKEGEYYTLVLLFNGSVCYKATIDSITAAEYINKHNNITLIK